MGRGNPSGGSFAVKFGGSDLCDSVALKVAEAGCVAAGHVSLSFRRGYDTEVDAALQEFVNDKSSLLPGGKKIELTKMPYVPGQNSTYTLGVLGAEARDREALVAVAERLPTALHKADLLTFEQAHKLRMATHRFRDAWEAPAATTPEAAPRAEAPKPRNNTLAPAV